MSLRSLTVHSVGLVCSNDSASTSSGVRSSPIFVRASRTARWTVTAASYWFSLLSRLTRLRLSTMLSVPPAAAGAGCGGGAGGLGPGAGGEGGSEEGSGAGQRGELEDRAARDIAASAGQTWEAVRAAGASGLLVERWPPRRWRTLRPSGCGNLRTIA